MSDDEINVGEGGRSSVKLARTSKGEATYEVKVYDEDPDVAKEHAVRLYEELTAKYHPELSRGGAR